MTYKKSMNEILDETFGYYSAHPRGRNLERNVCAYYVATSGAMCAVGRCMTRPQDFTDFGGGIYELCNHLGIDDIDTLLRPEYRGHSLEFWKELQDFHDCSDNWGPDGLTALGELRRGRLIRYFNGEETASW